MFRRLSSYKEALDVIERFFPSKPVGVEEIPLTEAYGRVIAEDATSLMDIPPSDRSVVDGYAVRSSDVYHAEESNPIILKFGGSVKIGELPKVSVYEGYAVEIVTGAFMPEGADSVVMVEYTERRGDEVLVYRPVTVGENVMKRGADIKNGEVLVGKGTVLTPFEIGALSAVGRKTVKVYRKPKVAIISTGPELVPAGEKLSPGKIYDINSYTLGSAARKFGGEVEILGIIEDNPQAIRDALLKALSEADVTVTSGGVSVGPYDLVPKILGELGEPGVLISGVSIKPGKPTTLALINGKPVFALPGQPTSALMTFHLFVRPVILRMAGRKVTPFRKVKAFADRKLFPARGRRTFIMVTLSWENPERLIASPVPLGLSGAITTLTKADGYIEIPENQQFIDEGEEVTVHLLKPLDY